MTVEDHDEGVGSMQIAGEDQDQYQHVAKSRRSTYPEEINARGNFQEGHGNVPDQRRVHPPIGVEVISMKLHTNRSFGSVY